LVVVSFVLFSEPAVSLGCRRVFRPFVVSRAYGKFMLKSFIGDFVQKRQAKNLIFFKSPECLDLDAPDEGLGTGKLRVPI